MLLNILSRIFLAHIIADFPLQFDWIFRMKKKGFLGGVPHASLHVLMIFLFLPDFWQYLLFYVGFGSTVLIFYLERTFLGISNENLSEFEKRYGVLERLLIFGLVSVDLRFLALAPAFYLVRRML